MAVLIEAISVIVRVSSIREKVSGGLEGFCDLVPNSTFCTDGDLIRVGFMNPLDVGCFIKELESLGLCYLSGGIPQDIIVVDQLFGPVTDCEWVECAHGLLNADGDEIVAFCQLLGSKSTQICCPEVWDYKQSFYTDSTFVPNGEIEERLKFLRHEDGVDVYMDLDTGLETFMGRTS